MIRRLFVVLALTLSTVASAQSNAVALGRDFATDDGLGRISAFTRFEKEVAPASRASALSDLWESVEGKPEAEAVRASVLTYLMSKPVKTMPWDARLGQHVTEAGKAKSVELRRLSLNTFAQRGPDVAKQETLTFLDDTDDTVRELAVTQVSRWADGKIILRDYVTKNGLSTKHKGSVSRARFLLDK
ncbi:hypothetical protein JY651_47250 [Pyxidicoccus parkwayensis]|uniref:Uncharacterized protein n=1 Tax=Pyxidicoccus parkwayensis TaxID=2813578 RepID=A0ABX7NUZ7_9BACT|nr:hypothetical protein [Pyxidicoccus parkwaysis]QSQ22625.1 hypothetical protein JY651_47250 [Pyxidicoccus parkwaysis]